MATGLHRPYDLKVLANDVPMEKGGRTQSRQLLTQSGYGIIELSGPGQGAHSPQRYLEGYPQDL